MAKKRSRPTSAASYQALLDKVQGMDLGQGGYWKPKQGLTKIRIMPAVGNMDFFFVEMGRHYEQNVNCPAIISGGKEACPVCELNEHLYQAGEAKAAAQYRVGRSFHMNIIERANEGAGPKIYTPGITVFRMLEALIGDPDYGDISAIDTGTDLKLTREGEGRDTEYQIVPVRESSPLSEDPDLIDEWLDDAEDLSVKALAAMLDYDAVMKAAGIESFFGDGDEIEIDADDQEDEDEDEDDDPEPPPVARRRRRR